MRRRTGAVPPLANILRKGRGLAGLAILAMAGCDTPGPGPWVQEDGYRWRELHPDAGGGFAPLDASERGIGFSYSVEDEARRRNRVLAEGQGVAVGDVDGDELADLFFAGFGGPSALYRNLGQWNFQDVTAAAGLAQVDMMARGAAFADLDGDGDLDLVVTVHGGLNQLFLGDGAGHFAHVDDAGFACRRGSTTPALADTDGDGDLDLYIANYKTRQVDDIYPPNLLDINRLQRDGDGELVIPPELRPIYEEHYRVEFDGRFVRRFEVGEPDEYYTNLGNGRFRPTSLAGGRAPASLSRLPRTAWPEDTATSGTGEPGDLSPASGGSGPASLVDAAASNRGEPDNRGWGLAARFSDWDQDGDADLYVANDFNSPDGIWINRGDGVFEPASEEAVRTTSLSSMAVDAGDLDGDGDIDLLTTDMLALDPAARLAQTTSFEEAPAAPGAIGTRVQVNRNAVQLNRGDGTFAEAAWELGLAASDWTWGALILDADLDGWNDIFVTTGHAWSQLDGDANARIAAIPGLPAAQALSMFEPLPQGNVAFRGGPRGFTNVSARWRWGGEADISHGLAAGDLDSDGDLDIVVTRLADPPLLYRNDAAVPRVLVRLSAAGGNTRGIGARIRLEGHPSGSQLRELAAGGSYLSSSEPAASFAAVHGAGMVLTVEWPGGGSARLGGIVANREYVIDASTADAGSNGGEAGHDDTEDAGRGESAIGRPPETHFIDVSELLGHTHFESAFDDRLRQPLMPYSLDRPGPGVSWIDMDGDGDADLALGSGAGGSPVVLRNDGGDFAAARSIFPAAMEYDATAILPHKKADGVTVLLVGQSAYEARTMEEAAGVAPLAVAVPPITAALGGAPAEAVVSEASAVLPSATALRQAAATGPLAQADTDLDGDIDLFIGGRATPGRYPAATDSRLLVNEGGALRADAPASGAFADAGLVSGALFTDADLDGDPDLVLALDWGGIRLFRNEEGSFSDAGEAAGLDGLSGRWNGIAAADFDEDGRIDLVATGWGANLEVPSAYSLFYGDMNRDGVADIIEARLESGSWRPIRGRDALVVPGGISSLSRVSYARFSSTPLPALVSGLDPQRRLDVQELRHIVLLNRPGGFERIPLPAPAQRAPALGVATGDLDGDGHEDIVLAQNFYAGRPGTPRYDAGRGLWLRGAGDGTFAPVPAQLSGIAVYGDGRAVALADYDRDRRVDVAYGVNGGATRLFRNAGGVPGIRVTLEGPPANPWAIGARLRLEYDDGKLGPVREIRSGEGYLSRNESVQTLGLAGDPRTLHVEWPDGLGESISIPAGVREVVVARPGGG